MEDLFFKIVPTVIAAFFGAYIASRRFMVEKKWDAKYQAYQDIFQAIHQLKYWSDQHYANINSMPSCGQDKLKKMAEAYEDAREKLWKFSSVGG